MFYFANNLTDFAKRFSYAILFCWQIIYAEHLRNDTYANFASKWWSQANNIYLKQQFKGHDCSVTRFGEILPLCQIAFGKFVTLLG